MNNHDIEISLSKLDKNFIEELTGQEKRRAFRSFKMHYAEQIGKATREILKRKKVHSNLETIEKQEATTIKQTDEELRKKMQTHQANRQKYQQNKAKEHKVIEQNWRRRWQEINHRRKMKEQEYMDKALELRKQSEQFWAKKSEIVTRDLSNQLRQSRNVELEAIKKHASFNQQHPFINKEKILFQKQKISNKSFDQRENFRIGKIGQRNGMAMLFNTNYKLTSENPQQCKDDLFKTRQNRCQEMNKTRQFNNFKNIVIKLNKIQQSRKNVQERIQKQVKEARKMRSTRQNPEVISRNQQRSQDIYYRKSRRRDISPINEQSNILAKSHHQKIASKTLQQHMNIKKSIEKQEFQGRQYEFERKLQKLKNGKIQRLVKKAISVLKHEALSQDY